MFGAARRMAVTVALVVVALLANPLSALGAPTDTPTPTSSPIATSSPTSTTGPIETTSATSTETPTPMAIPALSDPASRTSRIIVKYRDGVVATMDAGKPLGWNMAKSVAVVGGGELADQMSTMTLAAPVDLALARQVAAEIALNPAVEWAEPDQWRTIISDTTPSNWLVGPSAVGDTVVDVAVSGPNGSAKKTGAFTYLATVPAPTVSSLSVTKGPVAGGTTVTVTGTNLSGATDVTVGGASGTSLTLIDATHVRFVTPAMSAGTYDVSVTTPGGTGTRTSAFTYVAPPTISSLDKTEGPSAGGTVVIATGTNLTGATGVTVGGTNATAVTVRDATHVQFTTPAKTAGAYDISVTTAGGVGTLSSSFTYYASPTLASPPLSQAVGSSLGGQTVTISGTGLATTASVTFGGTPVQSIVSRSDSTVVVVTPAKVASTTAVNVVVTTTGGSATATSAFTFADPMTISGISPTSGVAGGGTSVTISGTNLLTATGVTFDGSDGSIRSKSATSIVVSAPAHALGTVDVVLVGPTGNVTRSSAFTYVLARPTLSKVSPTSGTVDGGATVTLTGTNLADVSSVTFGTVAATIQSRSATSVTVTTPARSAGRVSVVATGPGGNSTQTITYTYAIPAPIITSVSPNSGRLSGGNVITITGTRLTGTNSVRFGTSLATSTAGTAITVVSDTQVRVTTPLGLAGTKSIYLTAASGTTTFANGFTYVAAPKISSYTPTSGSTAGGTTVTITGTNLANASAVRFGANTGTITANTATSITVVTPAGVASTTGVTVSVTTPGGNSPSASTRFRYMAVPARAAMVTGTASTLGSSGQAVTTSVSPAAVPVISAISPTTGSKLGGTTVTITGTDLSAIDSVTFGGQLATIVSASSTSIVVTTPAEYVKSNPTESAYTGGTLWGLTGTYGVKADTAWSKTQGNPDVVVAVIDTGITTHTDLPSLVAGYDMISDALVGNDGNARDSNPADPGDWVSFADSAGFTSGGAFFGCDVSDSSWHGTHVTGTINAAINGFGSVGVAPNVKVQPVRALGKCGGYMSDITAGIIWAAGGTVFGVPVNSTPANVISLSLGGGGACSASEQAAIDFARSQGAVVTIAAGNENQDAVNSSPGNCNGVITVAATDSAGKRASFSNYGSLVEIAAPGVSIYSTLNSGTQGPSTQSYASYDGTSMATPHVAGVVALMLSRDPTLTPDQVLTRIQQTSTAFGGGSCDATGKTCGVGIINAGAAVQ